MTDHACNRTALYKGFVFLVAYLAVLGWGLSGLHHLRWIGVLSLPGVAAAVMLVRRWLVPGTRFWASLGEPLAYWPFLLVAGVALLGQLLYPPTMLDSLTYRLPRLFIWLQNNDLQHLLSGESRLNYMPQTWGLATLPLVQLAGDRLVWGWTFGSWILLYLLAYDWARELGGEVKKSRIMAFLASTSTFAVLQGASSANDLFAAVLALLALRWVRDFERTRDWRNINWAVLSFCIAAGTKPHYAVFGLPLTLWFIAAPSKPWRAFRWIWLPALLVVWLLCSPVPSFVLNYQTYGSWGGPAQGYATKGKSPVWNVALGTTMLAWQSVQLPVNPAAPVLDKKINQAVQATGLVDLVPHFGLRVFPVSMIDGAALGLVTALLMATGMVVALRRIPRMWLSWQMLALASGLVSIGLALSQFVPGAVGRTYCGFLGLALPLALAGWNLMRPQTLKWGMYLSLFSSLLVVILYPSHPLWPTRWVQQSLAASPYFHRLAAEIIPYMQYAERAVTGEKLMQAIPADETRVLALVGEDRPLLPLFRPYSVGRRILFLPKFATPTELEQLDVNYVVVGGGAGEFYPQLCAYLTHSGHYRLVSSVAYTSKLVRGAETWQLFQRNEATSPGPAMTEAKAP